MKASCSRNAGIDEESSPLVVVGMNEADDDDATAWLTSFSPEFDVEVVENALINVASRLVRENRDIELILLECTDMPIYTDAIRKETGLPVFDSVEMVRLVNSLVCQRG